MLGLPTVSKDLESKAGASWRLLNCYRQLPDGRCRLLNGAIWEGVITLNMKKPTPPTRRKSDGKKHARALPHPCSGIFRHDVRALLRGIALVMDTPCCSALSRAVRRTSVSGLQRKRWKEIALQRRPLRQTGINSFLSSICRPLHPGRLGARPGWAH